MVEKFTSTVVQPEPKGFGEIAAQAAERSDVPQIWKAAYEEEPTGAGRRKGDLSPPPPMTPSERAAGIAMVTADVSEGRFTGRSDAFFKSFFADSLTRHMGNVDEATKDLFELKDQINGVAELIGTKNSLVLNKLVEGKRFEFWYAITGPGIDPGNQFATMRKGLKGPTVINVGGFDK